MQQNISNVAVVGMACRFPGNINSPEDLWSLLIDKRSNIKEISPERKQQFFKQFSNSNWSENLTGSFFDEIDSFDPLFFNISESETLEIDPQHRLLLELVWQSFENAKMGIKELQALRSGIYLGLWHNDYEKILSQHSENRDVKMLTGSCSFSLPDRILSWLKLQGSGYAINTATSSGMVAVHTACEQIRSGLIDFGIAGSSNLIINPKRIDFYKNSGLISPEGKVKFGDAEANGFVPAEGAAVVLLMQPELAQELGLEIHAIIKHSAIGHAASSELLVRPDLNKQIKLIERTYKDANLDPNNVAYIECHGTGTRIGDTIELNALGSFFKSCSEKNKYIGSVKTNIGHTEACSGIAGLIKAILIAKNSLIPASLNHQSLNESVSWDDYAIKIPVESVPIKDLSSNSLIGVNCFGLTGMNVHLVLSPNQNEKTNADQHSRTDALEMYPLTLSENTLERLLETAATWREWLIKDNTNNWFDIAQNSNKRRNHLPHKLTLIANSKTQAALKLGEFIDNNYFLDTTSAIDINSKICLVFPGQGRKWWPLSDELFEIPVIKLVLEKCDVIYREISGESLLSDLRESTLQNENASLIQSALFAIQAAIFEHIISLGIKQFSVLGQSVGEIAAAYAARAINLEEGVVIAYHRGCLLEKFNGKGKVAVVRYHKKSLENILTTKFRNLEIGGINALDHFIVSGPEDELLALKNALDEPEFEKVKVIVTAQFPAHHSSLNSMRDEFHKRLEKINSNEPVIPFFSSLTGKLVQDHEIRSNWFWVDNVTKPTNIFEAITSSKKMNHSVFIEISPTATLQDFTKEDVQYMGGGIQIFHSMKQNVQYSDALAEIFHFLNQNGFQFGYNNFDRKKDKRIIIPPISIIKSKYWWDSPLTALEENKTKNEKYVNQSTIDIIIDIIAKEKRISLESIDCTKTLIQLGIDSLTVKIICRRIESNFDINISAPYSLLSRSLEYIEKYIEETIARNKEGIVMENLII